jgi:hypothetical protein
MPPGAPRGMIRQGTAQVAVALNLHLGGSLRRRNPRAGDGVLGRHPAERGGWTAGVRPPSGYNGVTHTAFSP